MAAQAVSARDLVLNVVFTPGAFRYLHWFPRTLLDHSPAQVRLVANVIDEAEVAGMDAMAAEHPERVSVFRTGEKRMVPYGPLLNSLYEQCDDGRYFAIADSDLEATGPFLEDLLESMAGAAAVTSGQPGWHGTDVLPEGAKGIGGRHIYAPDGFVHGATYFAIYDRSAVDSTRESRDIGFQKYWARALPPRTRADLQRAGRLYFLYDAAKLLNICLQFDGNVVRHVDHGNLVHIGGVATYLATSSVRSEGPHEDAAPDDAAIDDEARFNHAAFAAMTLRCLIDGEALPPLPALAGTDQDLMLHARDELVDLASRYLPA